MDLKVAALLNVGVLLLGLWAVWRATWERRKADFMAHRYEYFALRDRLGHLASTHHLSCDSPAYVVLVRMLNTYILYTERIDLVSFVAGALRAERETDPETEELLRAAKENPDLASIIVDAAQLTLRVLHQHSLTIRLAVLSARLEFRMRRLFLRPISGLLLLAKPARSMLEVKRRQEERVSQLSAVKLVSQR